MGLQRILMYKTQKICLNKITIINKFKKNKFLKSSFNSMKKNRKKINLKTNKVIKIKINLLLNKIHLPNNILNGKIKKFKN